ncbi:GlsB/YeaQ/YmgE family stress response membrane protein [Desulfosarcina sp. OttesenSCG-928-B08]|nr:GlsB/YeaQ/YmgE family stress response membrane protein [Desulfosarcina sp. OttesenSCG-928-B08]
MDFLSWTGVWSWVVLGLLAGLVAKFIMPKTEHIGFVMTIIVGIVGAVVGGYISTYFGYGDVTGLNPTSLGISVVGAVVVLFIYGLAFGKK